MCLHVCDRSTYTNKYQQIKVTPALQALQDLMIDGMSNVLHQSIQFVQDEINFSGEIC